MRAYISEQWQVHQTFTIRKYRDSPNIPSWYFFDLRPCFFFERIFFAGCRFFLLIFLYVAAFQVFLGDGKGALTSMARLFSALV